MSAFGQLVRTLNDPRTLAMLGRCLDFAYSENLPGIETTLADFEPLDSKILRWSPAPTDFVVSVWFADSVLILWTGLQSSGDVIDAYLRSHQIPALGTPGKISRLAGEKALEGAPIILADVAEACNILDVPEVDFFIAGHSQGGANALGFFAMTSAPQRSQIALSQIVSFQSPRSLDPISCAAIQVPHLRISMDGDLVSHVPPNYWTANYPPFSVPPLVVNTYVHHGTGLTIFPDSTGEMTGGDGPSLDLGAYRISRGILIALTIPGAHFVGYLATILDGVKEPFSGFFFSVPSRFGSTHLLGSNGMATYKLTYLFKMGTYGWSETFYVEASSIIIADLKATAAAVINTRVGLLATSAVANANNPFLSAVRISNINFARDSTLAYLNRNGTFSTLNYADAPNTAVLLQLRGSTNAGVSEPYKRPLYMRGNPDQLCVDGGKFNPDGAWMLALAAWGNAIRTNEFGMIGNSAEEVEIPNVLIANNGDDVEVTTFTPHGMTTGDKVHITGVLPKGILGGVFQIVVSDTDKYKILNRSVTGAFDWFGWSRWLKPTFARITSAQVQRIGHRDTGRPFDQPRGRQRTT